MALIDKILKDSAWSLAQARAGLPLPELKRRVRDGMPVRSLTKALGRFGLIAEIKAKSPSVGAMNAVNLEAAPAAYEASDAVVGISVLTQETFFGGSVTRLLEIRRQSSKPVLRKDFIFDEYQVYEARAFGADAILLMASLPVFQGNQRRRLKELFALAADLKMECLCEVGMASTEALSDVAALVPGRAPLWGVNSRQFSTSGLRFRQRLGSAIGKDLLTDTKRHADLWHLVPPGKMAVAESGIHSGEELEKLAEIGYCGALIGTAFLKGPASVQEVLGRFEPAVRAIRTRQRQERRTAAQG